MFPKRGEIYHVDGDEEHPPIGAEIWPDRPGLIVSNDTLNKTSGAVTIVWLSSSRTKYATPLHVSVTTGKNKPAMALCEQLQTVDKSRLRQHIATISEHEQTQIDAAVCMSVGIEQTRYRAAFHKWERYIREYHLEVAQEAESIKTALHDTAITTLTKQLSILEKERDGWRQVAEANQALVDSWANNEEQVATQPSEN